MTDYGFRGNAGSSSSAIKLRIYFWNPSLLLDAATLFPIREISNPRNPMRACKVPSPLHITFALPPSEHTIASASADKASLKLCKYPRPLDGVLFLRDQTLGEVFLEPLEPRGNAGAPTPFLRPITLNPVNLVNPV